jgi:hypothetical protein
MTPGFLGSVFRSIDVFWQCFSLELLLLDDSTRTSVRSWDVLMKSESQDMIPAQLAVIL